MTSGPLFPPRGLPNQSAKMAVGVVSSRDVAGVVCTQLHTQTGYAASFSRAALASRAAHDVEQGRPKNSDTTNA